MNTTVRWPVIIIGIAILIVAELMKFNLMVIDWFPGVHGFAIGPDSHYAYIEYTREAGLEVGFVNAN